MEKGLFVFDLDGTLIDSSGDIANSANRTLESFGRAAMDRDDIRESIGWGVNMLLRKLMPGIDDKTLDTARQRFLAFYGARLMDETRPYPGVLDTLKYLRKSGKKLAILTNKPEEMSRRIIKELGLESAFISIVGGDTFAVRKPDPTPLLRLMESAGSIPADTVFVGDSPIDCETGARADVFTIGVSYGFRPVKELKDAGCEVIISKFSILKEIFS